MLKRNSVTAARERKQAAERTLKPPVRSAPRKSARNKTAKQEVRITHPERIVFPGTDYSKQDVADYYRIVMPWMLPELADRPLSLLRCPSGAGSACFFQRNIHNVDQISVFATRVDVICFRSERVGGDQHAFNQHVGIAFHQVSIFEGAGLRFIRVANNIFRLR